jgi:hypothetical protein
MVITVNKCTIYFKIARRKDFECFRHEVIINVWSNGKPYSIIMHGMHESKYTLLYEYVSTKNLKIVKMTNQLYIYI